MTGGRKPRSGCWSRPCRRWRAAASARLARQRWRSAGALEALERGAREETFAPLSALLLARAAELCAESQALYYLDRAVACAPTLAHVYQARLAARLERGEVSAALADAEHLEAMANGAAARHAVCSKAAATLLAAGYVKEAGRAFERALRYMPEDARATAGLGRSLLSAGLTSRALTLFERAITLSEKRGEVDTQALLELGRLLAESWVICRKPSRACANFAESPEAEAARHLEGVYRGSLGDRVGASVAFGRMREAPSCAHSSSVGTVGRLRDRSSLRALRARRPDAGLTPSGASPCAFRRMTPSWPSNTAALPPHSTTRQRR